MVQQKERMKRALWNKDYDLIRQICSTWINLWIFLVFMSHLYCMWQYLHMQELLYNAPGFVSSSLTFATQYPTQSLSRVIHAKRSPCWSEIVNVIYILFFDNFICWCLLFIFEFNLRLLNYPFTVLIAF